MEPPTETAKSPVEDDHNQLAVAEENAHNTYQLIIKLIISRNPAAWEGTCTKVLKTGFGLKRGEKENSSFLQRLFILTADYQLHYVEPSGLVVKGTINLAGNLKSVLHSEKYETCLELEVGERTYYIQFKKDLNAWKIQLLQAATIIMERKSSINYY